MKQHPVLAIHRVSREWTPVFDEHLEPVVQDWTEKKRQIRLTAQDLRAMKQQMVDPITEVVLSWEPAAEQPDPAFATGMLMVSTRVGEARLGPLTLSPVALDTALKPPIDVVVRPQPIAGMSQS